MCNITQRRKSTPTPFWRGINKVKNIFWAGLKHALGSGERINFWKDKWLDYDCVIHNQGYVIYAVKRTNWLKKMFK